MRKAGWLGLAVLATLLIGAGAWTWGRSTFRSDVHATAAEGPAHPVPSPRAVVEETFHNFGVLDPAEQCAYVFTIGNLGDAPLLLERGPTTCDCTISHLPQEEVPPGAEVPVRVVSKLDEEEGEFKHSALIVTNDPRKKNVKLTITGTVRDYLGAHPSPMTFSDLRRGESGKARSIVYSQVWDAFAIGRVTPSREDLTWRIAPADPDRLAELNARCGFEIEVTAPAGLPGGTFKASLNLSAAPEGEEAKPQELTLRMRGRVPAFASLQGEQLNPLRDVVEMGVLRRGVGGESNLLLVVRDEPGLKIEGVEADPEFLEVRVEPATENGRTYRISVRVPPDAPPSNFFSQKKGEVRLRTDHPGMPVVKFRVEFAVAG